MGAVLQFTQRVETICCCVCGVQFGMPESLMGKRRDDGQSFWCPNGHPQSFTDSRVDRLEKQLKCERERRERTKQALDKACRSRDAYKGKYNHVKSHAGRGVCPCCRRSFTDLRRHMKTKHPDFHKEV